MRLLVVDDHPIVREVLGAVAQRAFDGASVRFAADLEQAFEQAREEVDLVLLDLGLPGCSGIDALTRFRKLFPLPRVVVVSATEDRACVLAALEAGAAAYVPKSHDARVIGAVLRLVAEGGTYAPPQALAAEGDAPQRLTERQLDVLRLIVKGLANKEIAARLRIAEDTVKHHACSAYAVLGVSSRTQAITAVTRLGIRLD